LVTRRSGRPGAGISKTSSDQRCRSRPALWGRGGEHPKGKGGESPRRPNPQTRRACPVQCRPPHCLGPGPVLSHAILRPSLSPSLPATATNRTGSGPTTEPDPALARSQLALLSAAVPNRCQTLHVCNLAQRLCWRTLCGLGYS